MTGGSSDAAFVRRGALRLGYHGHPRLARLPARTQSKETSIFVAGLMAALREGAEAAILISASYAVLARAPDQAKRAYVSIAVVIAGVASVAIIAGLVGTNTRVSDTFEDVTEGIVMILTVLLFAVLFRYLAGPARRTPAPTGRLPVALAATAVLLILREGPETAMELVSRPGGDTVTAAGALVGLVALLAFAVALAAGLQRLPWSLVSRIGRIGIALYAAGLMAHALSEFVQAGVLSRTAAFLDLGAWLPQEKTVGRLLRALIGYTSKPTLRELLVWAATMGGFVVLEIVGILGARRHASLPQAREADVRRP